MMRIEVSAPARLHLGDLDPFALGRFGYAPILAIDRPRTVIQANQAENLIINGIGTKEVEGYAKNLLEAYQLPGAEIQIKSVAPRHSGYGSTTQLCLAVGRAIAEAYNLQISLLELVKALKRTSTGGIYTFQKGGFVISGGFLVKPEEKIFLREEPMIPPLIFHTEFPKDWRFVLVRPHVAPRSPDSEAEENAFKSLRNNNPPTQLTHKAYFTLAAKLLPAILEKDSEGFGKALTEIQVTVGSIYQPIQGGVFNPASQWIIPLLRGSGAIGIGQSSWGPTVYGFAGSPEEAQNVEENLIEKVGNRANVQTVAADNHGARSETTS
jgi:beta-ribofuranosylaminobenzene 5'-phosphate synthase